MCKQQRRHAERGVSEARDVARCDCVDKQGVVPYAEECRVVPASLFVAVCVIVGVVEFIGGAVAL